MHMRNVAHVIIHQYSSLISGVVIFAFCYHGKVEDRRIHPENADGVGQIRGQEDQAGAGDAVGLSAEDDLDLAVQLIGIFRVCAEEADDRE